jgi:ABC-type transporter Mla maintaining outer membrane lipid asymmetry ATPase subunit MlaF
MLFQFGALFTDMSVYENVAFTLREHTDLTEELIRDLVLMKLHAVGCGARRASCRRSCRAEWRGAWRSPARSRSIRCS